MACNPDLAPRAQTPTFHTDVLRIFAGPAEVADDGDDADQPGPNADALEQQWQRVAVDAITVHLKKENETNISFPVASELLLPQWDWHATKPPIGGKFDPTWLVRHVSATACQYFHESPRGQHLLSNGALIHHGTTRHKKRLVDLGEDVFVLREARSDRAAFCIEVQEPIAEADEPVATE